jgi:hypothetical protein
VVDINKIAPNNFGANRNYQARKSTTYKLST